MRRAATGLGLACLLLAARPAVAQVDGQGRIEVSGGARWIGPIDFGGVQANENTIGNGTRALFSSSTRLDGSIGPVGRVGVRVTRAFRVEFAAAYGPTSLTTRISGDVEGVPDVTVAAPVTQFLLEGGMVAQPARWRRRRLAPFLAAGAGYLRQLNDGRTLVETGRASYVGGGVYYVRPTSGRRRMKATGVRLEARALFLQKGVAPDSSSRVTPALSVAVFTRF